MKRNAIAFAALLALPACAVPLPKPEVETGPAGTTIFAHYGGGLAFAEADMASYPGPLCLVKICMSGCTAALARSDVSITPTAELWFHGARVHGRGGGLRVTAEQLAAYDRQVADWYSQWPGLSEWFLVGDLGPWRVLTGAELNARNGVPLCGEGRG
jgi:hypothetical protein